MKERLEFSKRLIAAIEQAGYEPRASVVERNFNLRYWGTSVSYQGVRRWLKGDSIPEQDKLTVLAQWLGVEPYELRYGLPVTERKEPDKPWYVGLTMDDYEVITTFLKLSSENKKIIKDVTLALDKTKD